MRGLLRQDRLPAFSTHQYTHRPDPEGMGFSAEKAPSHARAHIPTHSVRETMKHQTRSHNVNEGETSAMAKALVTKTHSPGHETKRLARSFLKYPPPPLQTPGLARDSLPAMRQRKLGSHTPPCHRRHGTAEKCQEMKKQGAVAPLSHWLDTLSRVEQPKHDWGGESAAQVRMTEASRHECVGGMRMHGGEQKWYAPHAKQR